MAAGRNVDGRTWLSRDESGSRTNALDLQDKPKRMSLARRLAFSIIHGRCRLVRVGRYVLNE